LICIQTKGDEIEIDVELPSIAAFIAPNNAIVLRVSQTQRNYWRFAMDILKLPWHWAVVKHFSQGGMKLPDRLY
jgi:hypothetical protein